MKADIKTYIRKSLPAWGKPDELSIELLEQYIQRFDLESFPEFCKSSIERGFELTVDNALVPTHIWIPPRAFSDMRLWDMNHLHLTFQSEVLRKGLLGKVFGADIFLCPPTSYIFFLSGENLIFHNGKELELSRPDAFVAIKIESLAQ